MEFGIQCSPSICYCVCAYAVLGTEIREQSVSKQNFSKEHKSIVIQVTEYKQHTIGLTIHRRYCVYDDSKQKNEQSKQ